MVAALARCAIRQKDRIFGLVRIHTDMKAAHDIRTIRPVGDVAEARRFTLAAEASARDVEARQGGVAGRINRDVRFQGKLVGNIADRQLLVIPAIVARAERFSVEADRIEFELHTVENERSLPGAAHLHPGLHPRRLGIQ